MSCVVNCVACPRLRVREGSNAKVCSKFVNFQIRSQRVSAAAMSQDVDVEKPSLARELKKKFVEEVEIKKNSVLARELRRRSDLASKNASTWDLNEAYNQCVQLAVEDLSSILFTNLPHSLLNVALCFLLRTGSYLWKPEQQKALAAVLVWCRRTDELVDGINGSCTTLEVLDNWEQRLIDLFDGRPHDKYDAALFDTILKYPIDIELFKDFIEGMRFDLKKSRHENFNDLSLYCYHVAGSPALMIVQLMMMGMSSTAQSTTGSLITNSIESVYDATLTFAFACQLTDIIRDIPEDAKMGRIYLPQDELASASLSDDDVFSGKVTDKWRNFMKVQIKRAKMYCDECEKLIDELINPNERWIFWSITLVNRQILASIEANDYSFSSKVSPGIPKQVITVLATHAVSSLLPNPSWLKTKLLHP